MVPIKKLKLHWLTVLIHAWVLLSLASLARDYVQDQFLVDRVREITTRTGRMALTLLLLSLACTPVNTLLGYKGVLRVRRALGLYAFVYAVLHAWAFVGLDYGFDLELLGPAILDQRFVLAGLGAFLILLALGLLIGGAEPYLRLITDVCGAQEDCTLTIVDERALLDLGVTPSFFAWYLLVFALIVVVGSLIATWLIISLAGRPGSSFDLIRDVAIPGHTGRLPCERHQLSSLV